MSKERCEKAILSEYGDPVFPTVVDDLNGYSASNNLSLDGCDFEQLGETFPEFVLKDRPVTSDGYAWFWVLHFKLKEGFVAVAFPWSQDWDRADGSLADRSIAVYICANADPQEVLRFLESFTHQFRRFLDLKYLSRTVPQIKSKTPS